MKPCTCCGKSAPEVEFGLRLYKGQRQQRSWCRTCEGESNRHAQQKFRARARAELKWHEDRVVALIEELATVTARLKELRK